MSDALITRLLEMGTNGVTLLVLYFVWRRLERSLDFIERTLEELLKERSRAEAQRAAIAEAAGVNFADQSSTRLPVQR